MRKVFDSKGHLLPGREEAFLAEVFPGDALGKKELLHARKVLLALRILQIHDGAPEDFSQELKRLARVGRQLGFLDEGGHLVDHPITRQARAEYQAKKTIFSRGFSGPAQTKIL